MNRTAVLQGGPHNGLHIPMDTHLQAWIYVGPHAYRRTPFNGTPRLGITTTYEHVYSPLTHTN